jgi:hypothetical protein
VIKHLGRWWMVGPAVFACASKWSERGGGGIHPENALTDGKDTIGPSPPRDPSQPMRSKTTTESKKANDKTTTLSFLMLLFSFFRCCSSCCKSSSSCGLN